MHTTLHCINQRSNKVYRIAIEPRDGGYVVNFAYGRSGSTLNTGTKTTSPVYFDAARMIYDKVVKEKLAKGYVLAADSQAYATGSRKVTNIRPQLLNAVEDPEPLIEDERFCIQPKRDGKRLLLHKQGFELTGINRRGIECGFPESIRAAAAALPHNFLLDGEAVGDTLHVFDLLEVRFTDLRPVPYPSRRPEVRARGPRQSRLQQSHPRMPALHQGGRNTRAHNPSGHRPGDVRQGRIARSQMRCGGELPAPV